MGCFAYIDVSVNDFPGIRLGDYDAVYRGCCVGHVWLFDTRVLDLNIQRIECNGDCYMRSCTCLQ